MSEGSAVRTKRARSFKNPPQPYMCIRDTLKGSSNLCYVNVLSWDKVAAGDISAEDVPLYGGMKLYPRSEKEEVFAVMAHPDVLKQHGKNTHNPWERTWLIDILLDYVEKMNDGVVFNRRYRVMRDRDITGELKEIWMAVQEDKVKNEHVASEESSGSEPAQNYQSQKQQQERTQQVENSYKRIQQPERVENLNREQSITEETKNEEQEAKPGNDQPQPDQRHLHFEQKHQKNIGEVTVKHSQSMENYSDQAGPRIFPEHQETQEKPNRRQPPQYNSNMYYHYDRKEAAGDRRWRCQQQVTSLGKYPMNDHFRPSQPVYPDVTLPSSQVVNNFYHPPDYKPLPRQINPVYPPYFRANNPPVNFPVPPPIGLVGPEASLGPYKLNDSMEMNKKSLHPSSGHLHLVHTPGPPPVRFYYPQNTTVIMGRPEEPENFRRQHIPGQNPRFSGPKAPHYPNNPGRHNGFQNSASSAKSHPRTASFINFVQMFGDRAPEAGQTRNETVVCHDESKEPSQQRICLEAHETSPRRAQNERKKIELLKRCKTLDDDRLKSEKRTKDEKPETEGHEDKKEGQGQREDEGGSGADKNGTVDERSSQISPSETVKTEESRARNTVKISVSGATNKEDASEKCKQTNGHAAPKSAKKYEYEVQQFYTILKKPEATTSQERVTNVISQLSLSDASTSKKVRNVNRYQRLARLDRRQ